MELVLLMPPGGGELGVGGKPMGGTTIRLVDADPYALCEPNLLTEAWPPRGSSGTTGRSGVKLQRQDCVVPPLVVGGDYVWHSKIVNAGTEKRIAAQFRAVDAAGSPLEVASEATNSSMGILEARETHAFRFAASSGSPTASPIPAVR